tara:strand:- start:689 stop:1447 length:759 start_codon:yes stop_codon:yes gene_type:complete
MARISTYAIDTLDANDKLLGTDQGGATKNFKINDGDGSSPGDDNSGSLTNYIVEADARALAFLFHNNTFGGKSSMQPGTINVTGAATTKAFSTVTTLKVSKFPYAASIKSSPSAAINILNEYVGQRIKWSDINNPNIYGIYECISFVQDGSTDFYDMALVYISGNGNFTAGDNTSTTPDIYLLEIFGSDKNYEHTQNSSSETWEITHNLNKFPDVVVQTSAGVIGRAAVTYQSKNQLTVSLSGADTGKAYLN